MPRQRGQRVRIAPGIYQDMTGIAVVAAVGSGDRLQRREHRYPHNTPLRVMQQWQAATRKDLEGRHAARVANEPQRGTLRADIRQYLTLESVKALPSYESRVADLSAWLDPFGDQPRHRLTTDQIDEQLHIWRKTLAVSTCNHRRNALIQFFVKLDGGDVGADHVRRTTHFKPPDPEPRGIDQDVLEAILTAMPESMTKVRLRLMMLTGWPQQRIRQLRPDDIKWDQRAVYLPGRKKGQGTIGRMCPINDQAVAALKVFAERNAWGDFAKETMYIVFQRAVKKVNAQRVADGLPSLPKLRPYDVRHTYGARAYAKTGDTRTTADLLDCSDETARRYTLSAVPDVLRRAVDLLDQD